VPSAIRQNHELAEKGLISILVESQGSNPAQLEQFLWNRFADNECFTCTGTFVPIPESRGIPHAAVIGVDGKLLWAGNPAASKQQIEQLVEEQLKLVKKGWGDSSDAKKARAALYGKGNLASAAAVVAAMADGEEKANLQKEIDNRYAILKAAISSQQNNGHWLAAQDAAKALLKGVGRHETWLPEVTELVASFATDSAKVELAFDKKLDKILSNMRKGNADKAPKALEKLIEKAGQGGVGKRAARTLAALQTGS
jgi:hypothetical protein